MGFFVCFFPPCRFVFHQFTSTKLDNKVHFPIEDLSFSEFMSPDCSLVYDLQSAVCHFGGMFIETTSNTDSSDRKLDSLFLVVKLLS